MESSDDPFKDIPIPLMPRSDYRLFREMRDDLYDRIVSKIGDRAVNNEQSRDRVKEALQEWADHWNVNL